jgi:cardiolipin synthase
MSHDLPSPRVGHQVLLLQGSGELFPALVEAMDAALREVRLETYILDFDGLSVDVAHALERAGRRGVKVQVLVDGFGSPPLPHPWQERFLQAGVEVRIYAPLGRFGVLRLGSWRRLHRKLCVVDGRVAFCGGINILDDYKDLNHGPLLLPRFDFAVRVTGPLVAEVDAAMARLWLPFQVVHDIRRALLTGVLDSLRASGMTRKHARLEQPDRARPLSRASLVLRDNLRNRARIERAYRVAIGRACDEIIIANAYFVPGRKLLHALVSAARRGVKVQLLLQGRYEYFMQYYAARPIYSALLGAGVEIYEYSPSFLHAKVAVIDGRWATVGSSNLDPLSLLLALEANVLVVNRGFARILRDRLLHAIRAEGRPMDPAQFRNRPLRQRFMEGVAHALMRLALVVQGKKYL